MNGRAEGGEGMRFRWREGAIWRSRQSEGSIIGHGTEQDAGLGVGQGIGQSMGWILYGLTRRAMRAVAFALVLAALVTPTLARADQGDATTPSAVTIRLESEPRLQAPMRTLVSSSPQTYTVAFIEAMNRSSVEKSIETHGIVQQRLPLSRLDWKFVWDSDHLLHATATALASGSPASRTYYWGEYQVNVNGALTAQGAALSEAPVLLATIQNPQQLWRYAADGSSRELVATVDAPYSFRMLPNEERYLFAVRGTQFCECDAVFDQLYALYDLQEQVLIRYPVPLQLNYRGNGDFVADRRGFFYEQPTGDKVQSLPIPAGDTLDIHVDGYVHGANWSKDGKYILMAVGKPELEPHMAILLYSTVDGTTQVLAESLTGWAPEDPGFGRRMPVTFYDDGERVTFALDKREPYGQWNYTLTWQDQQPVVWEPPAAAAGWSGFTSTSDRQYRFYANGGIYRGSESVYSGMELSYWQSGWVNGTHLWAASHNDYNRQGNELYTGSITLFDADRLEQRTLYSGLYYDSGYIGSSRDGHYLYVQARQPVVGSPLPDDPFGRADGKLLVEVKPDTRAPIVFYIQGKRFVPQQAPFLENRALYVPLRETLEEAGWTVTWGATDQVITGRKSGRSEDKFQFTINSGEARFNGRSVSLPLAPKLVDGTTYMYAGILQMIGMKLDWDTVKQVMTIEVRSETGGLTLSDGTWYEGGLRGNIPWGVGRQLTTEGRLLYEGEFENGLYHGPGKLFDVTTGKLVYTGTFVEGTARVVD